MTAFIFKVIILPGLMILAGLYLIISRKHFVLPKKKSINNIDDIDYRKYALFQGVELILFGVFLIALYYLFNTQTYTVILIVSSLSLHRLDIALLNSNLCVKKPK